MIRKSEPAGRMSTSGHPEGDDGDHDRDEGQSEHDGRFDGERQDRADHIAAESGAGVL